MKLDMALTDFINIYYKSNKDPTCKIKVGFIYI